MQNKTFMCIISFNPQHSPLRFVFLPFMVNWGLKRIGDKLHSPNTNSKPMFFNLQLCISIPVLMLSSLNHLATLNLFFPNCKIGHGVWRKVRIQFQWLKSVKQVFFGVIVEEDSKILQAVHEFTCQLNMVCTIHK